MSVEALLERIKQVHDELIKKGILRASQPLPEVAGSEVHEKFPAHWRWVRFGDVAQHNSGKTLDKARNTGISRDYITTSNLYWGQFDLSGVRQMLIEDEELDRCTARTGDLLICEGGEAGRAAVWDFDREVCFQNHVHRARFFFGINPYFAYRFFEKINATGEINQYRRGVGISNMSGKALASIPFPLPPTEEQQRIVDKVDALMGWCDKLEKQQQERKRRFPVLSRACHSSFTESLTQTALNRIFDEIGSIIPSDLRKTILLLAFAGKLISQDPNDEPAAVLLEKARAEKSRLIEAGIVKREPWAKKLHGATSLYRLPPGWQWTHVSDVVEKVTVGFVGSMKQQYRSAGVPFLRSQNVRENRYQPLGLTYISEEFHRAINKSALTPGDVVVTRSGNVGVTCVIPESLPEANCSDLVIVKRPLALVPAFLSYFINSIAGHQIEAKTVGIALTHFNTQSVAQMTIALPPLPNNAA